MTPVAPVPTDTGTARYALALAEAKAAIQASRTRAVLAVNAELIGLYWRLGRLILDRQSADGWGTKVIDRLSADLRAAFPEMTGLSIGNLKYMRVFAREWPDDPIGQQLVDQLPWGHNIVLVTKLRDRETREWYARATIEHGWSRAVLEHQIGSQLHRRTGQAPSNFSRRLPAPDSELVQQIVKDPYNLDFLTLDADVAERDLEMALVAHVQDFLLELGRGFAFVGRQYRLDIDGDELFIDLLMFHIPTVRYVVIELKTGKIAGGDIGQLNTYVAAVDDVLRKPGHADTVGLLLGGSRNQRVVRYALARSTSPMAVAGYRYTELPAVEQGLLPPEDALADVVTAALDEYDAIHDRRP